MDSTVPPFASSNQIVLTREELSRLLTASREEGFILAMILLNKRVC